jgi:hypothetical protein
MDSNISVTRVIALIVFVIVFGVLYYKKLLNVSEGESKKIEMIKRVFVLFIILGLMNTLTITDDENYKAFILVIIVCILNIYNSRHIFKYCPQIPVQFKITQYIRMSIITILIAIGLKYTNDNGLLSILYSRSTTPKASDKGRISRKVDVLNIALSEKMPSFCPDMSDDDYTKDGTSENNIWNNLSVPSQNLCTDKKREIIQREDLADDIYK